MKKYLSVLIACLALLGNLAACDSGTSTSASRNSAPNFIEIRANIVRIVREAQTAASAIPTDSQNSDFAADIAALSESLKGKEVNDWEGWVQHVRHVTEGGTGEIMIDMDQFYDRNRFLTFEYRGVRRIGFPDVLLEGITGEQTERLTPGERIRFQGTIRSVERFGGDPANGLLGVLVSTSEITSLGGKERPSLADVDPKAVVITLTQPVCGMLSSDCYTYELTIRGDGTGIYAEDDWDTIDEATNTISRTFTVEPAEFADLLQEFTQLDYFSLKEDYDGYDMSDAGSNTTSITTPTHRKSVFHYHGDFSAPDGLSLLEDKIDSLKKRLGHKER